MRYFEKAFHARAEGVPYAIAFAGYLRYAAARDLDNSRWAALHVLATLIIYSAPRAMTWAILAKARDTPSERLPPKY